MDESTTHYTVLARRFRPQTFEEVVGQQHVAQGLLGAIQQGRVAHAYLFAGARGVGKTSMARILAKALDCPNANEGVPCNDCEICAGIAAGNDVDVLEIDGASNRGIDDIRSLRANVNIKPMRTKYKIYIIDEVHMLTKEAFNALLKTLEEPPANVKFVFCTTEPNKLPDTILSRCQRFDFAAIESSRIEDRLRQITVAEGFQVDAAALELVARRAAGSMRDSQSLLDQLLAFGEEQVTLTDVHRLLGTADDERLVGFVNALVDRDRSSLLQQFDAALAAGVQLSELMDQLLGYHRDLMVIASGADGVSLLSVSERNRDTLARQAESWGLETIVAAMQILSEAKTKMMRTSFGRTLAELALVRISLLDELQELGGLIEELRTGATHGGTAIRASLTPGAPKTPAGVANSAPVDRSTEQPVAQKKSAPPTNRPDCRVDDSSAGKPSIDFREGCEQRLWSQVLVNMNDMLKNHVQAVNHVAISGPNCLDLTFPKSYDFSKRYCEQPEVLSRIEQLVTEIAGRPIRISFRLLEETPQEEAENRPETAAVEDRPTAETDDPYVEQVKTVFGATVVKVEAGLSPSNREE